MSEELFTNKTTIEFDTYYIVEKTKSGNSVVRLIKEEEAIKILANEDAKVKEKVKKFRTWWKLQGWEANNKTIAQATVYNQFKGENEVDPFKYRDARLKNLLLRWDLKTKEGNEVPLSVDAINSMQTNIASALLDKYDELTSVDSEEQAKN